MLSRRRRVIYVLLAVTPWFLWFLIKMGRVPHTSTVLVHKGRDILNKTMPTFRSGLPPSGTQGIQIPLLKTWNLQRNISDRKHTTMTPPGERGGNKSSSLFKHQTVLEVSEESFVRLTCQRSPNATTNYTRLCSSTRNDTHAQRNTSELLLTMFTSIRYNSKEHHISMTVLRLWPQLGEQVKAVLFVSDPAHDAPLIHDACALGWDVYVAPRCNYLRLPVLKAMFSQTRQLYDSVFYGYANGDIVFDESLLRTLHKVRENMNYFTTNLMVGRRTNIKVDQGEVLTSLTSLRERAREGRDGWVAAVDYFISSRDGYPWQHIPEMVIGRRAYDNWLIWNAKRRKIKAIEISQTALSVHINPPGNYYRSHGRRDGAYNIRVLGRFSFTSGLISCAPYVTVPDQAGQIRIMRRVKYSMCGAGDWGRRKRPLLKQDVLVDI